MAEMTPKVLALEGVGDGVARAYLVRGDQVVDSGFVRDGQVTFGLTEDDEQYDDDHYVLAGADAYAVTVRNLFDPGGLIVNRLSPAEAVGLRERIDFPAYEGLVHASELALTTTPIGHVPATDIPMNRTLSRFTARYFQVESGSLLSAPTGGWVPGNTLEYDVSFEPAGWALDDWISTTALAPHEDRVHSDSTVDLSSATEQDERLRERAAQVQVDDGIATTRERLTTRADASSSARGFDLGLGGTHDNSTTTNLINPVKAITEAVTGALQVGVNWSSGTNRAEQQSALQRSVTEHFRRDTSQFRDGRATAAARTLAAVDDHRSLAAIRNLIDRELNLATYSVVKQWRVAAVVSDCKPVVFVPIDKVDVDFTVDDVFVHRTALQFALALLDESLAPTIDRVVESYNPDEAIITIPAPSPAPADGGRTIVRITGEATFSDPAEGPYAEVHIHASFRIEGDEYEWLGQEVDAFDTSSTASIDIAVNRRLSRYGGARVVFRNRRRPWSDQGAVVRTLQLLAELDDGTTVRLHEGSNIQVRLGAQTYLPPDVRGGSTSHTPPSDSATSADANRLLRHLNRRRSYYRLAIDLQQDSATRFERLRARHSGGTNGRTTPEAVTPVDFDPVGVVGGYLAFLTASSVLSFAERVERGVDGDVQLFLVSTPSGGTFTEVILGETATPPSPKADVPRIPTGAADAPATYPWPERVAPTPTTISSILAPSNPPNDSAPRTTTGDSELKSDKAGDDKAGADKQKAAETAKGNKPTPAKDGDSGSGESDPGSGDDGAGEAGDDGGGSSR